MSVSISQLLHKLDDRIRRFIKDDGILDSEDQEVVWQKAKKYTFFNEIYY